MANVSTWLAQLEAYPNSKYPNAGYPEFITQRFGRDLDLVLGPKQNRVSFETLSQAEVERRLELVSDKLFLKGMRGGKQQLLQTFYEFLEHLEETKALWGVDIPMMNILPMNGVELHEIEKTWINYRTQRVLHARHVVQIIFKFDPWSVFNGIGRMTSDLKKLWINDGQHRSIACMMFGVRYVAVQYQISDSETVDIDQFCACNVDNLPSELYDDFHNRKERCGAYIEAGRAPIREDKFMWDIAQWADRFQIKICRTGDPMSNAARGISHMPDIYKSARMGFDVMNAAAAVLVTVYPTDPMKSANLVGLCELLRQQDPEWLEVDIQDGSTPVLNPMLEELARVLKVRFGNIANNQNSGTFHSTCKEAVNNWYKAKTGLLTNPSGIAPEIKVAHATYHVFNDLSNGGYTMTKPVNSKGEHFEVLSSFTQGYKQWMTNNELISA